jgi:hypothetical protein
MPLIFSQLIHGTTSGLQFLGYPLGSPTFAKQFLNKAITKFSTLTAKFKTKLLDLQTKGQLFCSCAQPSVSYNLAADVYHNYNTNNPPPFHFWNSPFISELSTIYHTFYQHLRRRKMRKKTKKVWQQQVRSKSNGNVTIPPMPYAATHTN